VRAAPRAELRRPYCWDGAGAFLAADKAGRLQFAERGAHSRPAHGELFRQLEFGRQNSAYRMATLCDGFSQRASHKSVTRFHRMFPRRNKGPTSPPQTYIDSSDMFIQ